MRARRAIVLGAAAAGALAFLGLDLAAFLGGAEHHGGFWNRIPFGDLALGALGAGVLLWTSGRILKPLLTRPEDHYGGAGEP